MIILFLTCQVFAQHAGDDPFGDDQPSDYTSDQFREDFETDPLGTATKYPELAKENWDLIESKPEVKAELFKSHMDKFSVQFEEEMLSKGINIKVGTGSSFDSDTGTLTTADGSTIDVNSFAESGYVINVGDGGKVTITDRYGHPVKIEGGTNIKVDADEVVRSDEMRKAEIEPRGEGVTETSVELTEASGVEIYPNGDWSVESAMTVELTTTITWPELPAVTVEATIVNGKGIQFSDGQLTAEHTEIIFQQETIAHEVSEFETDFLEFSVEEAEMIYHEGLKVYDVINTTFRVSDEEITILPQDEDIVVKINDSNENSLTFEPLWDIESQEEILGINATALPLAETLPGIEGIYTAEAVIDKDMQLLDSLQQQP